MSKKSLRTTVQLIQHVLVISEYFGWPDQPYLFLFRFQRGYLLHVDKLDEMWATYNFARE